MRKKCFQTFSLGWYCLSPTLLEFWQGRSSRLHDRIVYTKNNKWSKVDCLRNNQYFKRFNFRTIKVSHQPLNLKIIVVVPIYNEEENTPTLESLFHNQVSYSFSIEVSAVVNDSSLEKKEIKEFNQKTFIKLKNFAKNNNNSKAFLIPIYIDDLDPKHAG